VALATLGVPQWQPHVSGLTIRADEELHRVKPGDRPHPDAHGQIRAAVTRDAADLALFLMVKPREIGGGRGEEPCELLVVEVAGHAEAVVALLGGEPDEEERAQQEGPRRARRPEGEAPSERAGDGGPSRRLPGI